MVLMPDRSWPRSKIQTQNQFHFYQRNYSVREGQFSTVLRFAVCTLGALGTILSL